ncbi:MAG: hypothetical protein A2201_08580 [Alicyclobacillus sp. RIFOXYA1_FULL_53_8]|nr:MAG: hypothetical protein A2201_08580 [Alicyclobacillus sp. RIFOXYA1_FULL_53_8]
MFGFIVSAHGYLILGVSVAVLLVLADSGTVLAFNNWIGPLIASHILFAAGGFFSFLVMGFSFKLLSMFTLSHGFAIWHIDWYRGICQANSWMFSAS